MRTADRKLHFSDFHTHDPELVPDKDANVAVIRGLKRGDVIDVTIQTFSSKNGYGYRRYHAAAVTWITVIPDGSYAVGQATTGASSNRSRIWLEPFKISRIEVHNDS